MASKDYQKQLNRLKEEQQKALKETDDNIKQWEKFQSDYDALKNRLKTLPDKVSHDVMVPFGKMGFMPGRLVHTNEILVLLGDNWFAERSAKQAAEIVTRRTTVVDKKLEELRKQRALLEPRKDFTEELQAMAQGGGDKFDIQEEYDEDKEKLWREQHKRNTAEHRKQMKKAKDKQQQKQQQREKQQQQQKQQQHLSDAQLWERLDELERIELREREMEKLDAEQDSSASSEVRQPVASSRETESCNRDTKDKDKPSISTTDSKQTYTLSDEESDTSSRSLDSDDYEEDDEDDEEEEEEEDEEEEEEGSEEEEEITAKGKVINFMHSQTQDPGGSGEGATSYPSESASVLSPADIYAKFRPPQGPTSILKKSKAGAAAGANKGAAAGAKKGARERREKKRVVGFDTGSEGEEPDRGRAVQERVSTEDLQKAFSGTVKEKVVSGAGVLMPGVAPSAAPSKPVSKFKSRSSANQNTPVQEFHKHANTGMGDAQTSESVRPVSKFKAQRQNLKPT